MVQGNTNQTFDAMENSSIELPDGSAFADMEMARDGQNLVLKTAEGGEIVVENYFLAEPQPIIEASDGSALTPELVQAFTQSPEQLSQIETAAGTEPVGAIEELHGEATVIRADGSSEPVTLGTPIFEGDVIETSQTGGVNILFIDETSMAVSEGARFAVKDYSFDPETESGTTNFSVLRGVFVFTSGLIGRDDPDDVTIDTPVGSIGIRGTIIAGKIDPEGESSITVVEGAIVVKNGGGEQTLDQQFETVHIQGFNAGMKDMGIMEPADVSSAYGSASYVIPSLFSNIDDVAKDKAAAEEQAAEEQALEAEAAEEEVIEEPVEEMKEPISDMMQEQTDKPLEFKLTHEGERTETDRKHGHKQQQQKGKSNNEDDLTNPDVIVATNTPDFFINNWFKEDAGQGDIIARIPDVPSDVKFFFIHSDTTKSKFSEDGNFEIIGHRIALTAAGESNLNGIIGSAGAQGFNTDTSFGSANTIMAIGPDGQKVTKTFDPVINDVNLHLGHSSGYSQEFDQGFTKINDINNDGHRDFVYINGSDVDIIDNPDNMALLHRVSNGPYASVTNIGDVDNDGYDEIVAGNSSATSNSGAVDYISWDGTSLNGGLIAPPTPVTNGDFYGHSVAGAGDFDGDGQLDYIVGAPGTDNGGTDTGSAYIISSLWGELEMYGTTSNTNMGAFVDGIGDFDGDGLSDVLIGGQGHDQAHIVFGGRNVSGTVNSDITIDTGGHTIVAGSSAGDFNADGFDDMIIAMDDGSGNVVSYVLFGDTSTPGTVNLTYLENPENAFKITDYGASAAGYTVRSVGDPDGDGFDNIEIGSGSNFHMINGVMAGNAPYVTDGSAADGNNASDYVEATADGQVLIGSRVYYDGGGSNVDVTMIGDDRDNYMRVSDDQFRVLDGGQGHDTIRYGVNGGTLDFTNIEYEQISGIERIEITGASGQSSTVRLTVENIFNLLKTSDNGQFVIDEGNGFNGTLIIDDTVGGVTGGNVYDQIEYALSDQSSQNFAQVTHGAGGGYDIYNVGSYQLFIDQNLTTSVV